MDRTYTQINIDCSDEESQIWGQVRQKGFSYWNSFKNFISDSKGNILSLAVAFIIAESFKAIITSLVNDILMPPIGLLPGANLENWFILLKHGKTANATYFTIIEAQNDGAITENIGPFFLAIMNFIIITLFLWLIVQLLVGLKDKLYLQKIEEEATEFINMIECPGCLESVKRAATRCKFCCMEFKKIPNTSTVI